MLSCHWMSYQPRPCKRVSQPSVHLIGQQHSTGGPTMTADEITGFAMMSMVSLKFILANVSHRVIKCAIWLEAPLFCTYASLLSLLIHSFFVALCPVQLWPPHSFGTLSESPTERIIKTQSDSDSDWLVCFVYICTCSWLFHFWIKVLILLKS